jgi:formate--tetrahydrofolate ligase
LAKDEDDLRRRIENILLGFTYDNKPFTVKDLGVAGAITVLLKDALSPNLVQTTENTPAFVHGGPFANIAHGCNSVLATKLAMTFGDYAITEAGFGADLGAEKFYDIKCRKAGLNPKLTVLVVTARALKMHGGVSQDIVGQPNLEALKVGVANMDKHLENLSKFGQSVVVAFNRYGDDVQEEIDFVRQHCAEQGFGFAVNNAFVEGGQGAVELAELVVKTIEENPSAPLNFAYTDEDDVKTKVTKVATNLYGANLVTFSPAAKKKLAMIEELGYTHFPICIAKTQYSFSTNPKLINVPKDFEFQVQDIVINAGAEMLVVISGEIMRMPGLPKLPQALHIDIVDGEIEGLS